MGRRTGVRPLEDCSPYRVKTATLYRVKMNQISSVAPKQTDNKCTTRTRRQQQSFIITTTPGGERPRGHDEADQGRRDGALRHGRPGLPPPLPRRPHVQQPGPGHPGARPTPPRGRRQRRHGRAGQVLVRAGRRGGGGGEGQAGGRYGSSSSSSGGGGGDGGEEEGGQDIVHAACAVGQRR